MTHTQSVFTEYFSSLRVLIISVIYSRDLRRPMRRDVRERVFTRRHDVRGRDRLWIEAAQTGAKKSTIKQY